MNRFIHLLTVCSLCAATVAGAELKVPTEEEMKSYLARRPERDLIRWKDEDRGVLLVRILEVSTREVSLQKTVNRNTLDRRIPMYELASVSFSPTELEVALMDDPVAEAAPALRVLWDSRKALIGAEGSSVGGIGLALARSLRMGDPLESFDEASGILDLIRAEDRSEERRAQAGAELQTLELARSFARAEPEETDRLAWAVTESERNPEGMLLATAWLADRHFSMLKELEKEHPRWDEDEEVRPLRQRLYNLSLDFALYPSLFLGRHEANASEGLLKVWKVYQYTGEDQLALNVLEDIATLYPESGAAVETAEMRSRLIKRIESGDPGDSVEEEAEAEEESDDGDESETDLPATPPKPKRYNIFDD